jgi:hypothetical protein
MKVVIPVSSMKLEMTGDWNRAGLYMRNLAVKLKPAFEAQLWEDGQMVLEKMRGHIDSQDLSWTPLAERTIELKGGDDTIYVETGALKNGLTVRRIKSSARGSTIFIGASPWKRHEGGMKMSDLMIWLEYGTDKIPPRPLVRPTIEEVEDIIKSHWKELFQELVKG